ncbi:dihydroorotase family protein [Aciditerrimonas ferrireducens]|uniref:Dihydroorotase family protein n=1 Tax=Aciditerrimonas ferrireducens TaxID=667306 RepID=A0ABV6C2Y9_9ACTN
MSPDLVVRAGTLVAPGGRAVLDVVVEDGRVAALVPAGTGRGARVLEAEGRLVLPGMVDSHVHVMEPGDTSREEIATATAAAARHGITTIVEHTHGWPVTSVARLHEKRGHWAGRSFVDYGFAAHVWPDAVRDLPALYEAGVAFFKIFTCATHGVPALVGGRLLSTLETLAALGAPCLVHCEDDQLTADLEAALRASGRVDAGTLLAWRTREAELMAIHAVGVMAETLGARVTVAHASTPEALAAVAWHRARGADLVAETCPQYLTLPEREVLEQGPLRKCTPPPRLRSKVDEEAMWRALEEGLVHHLATDHAPATLAQKRAGTIWDAPFGLPGLDTTVPVLLDAALRGRVALERLVQLWAQAPARRYGLRGKGRIAPGFDADLVLVDPAGSWLVRDEEVVSKAGWSPYSGRLLRGRVVTTVLRGEVIAQDGVVLGDPRGRLVLGGGWRDGDRRP